MISYNRKKVKCAIEKKTLSDKGKKPAKKLKNLKKSSFLHIDKTQVSLR